MPIKPKQSQSPITFDDLFEILQFSSFPYYAAGVDDPLMTPSPAYLCLGETLEERQELFREMVEDILEFDWLAGEPDRSLMLFHSPELVLMRIDEILKTKKFN